MSDFSPIEILISSDTLRPTALRAALRSGIKESEARLHVRPIEGSYGGVTQPEVLVAIIGAAGAGFAAVIAAVCHLAAARRERVVIQGSGGRRVEFPSSIDQEVIDRYVRLARELDSPQIVLTEDTRPSNPPIQSTRSAGG